MKVKVSLRKIKFSPLMAVAVMQISLFVLVTIVNSDSPISIIMNGCFVAMCYKAMGEREGYDRAMISLNEKLQKVSQNKRLMEGAIAALSAENKLLKSKLAKRDW